MGTHQKQKTECGFCRVVCSEPFFLNCAQADASCQLSSHLLMVMPGPSTTSTPRKRFNPTPLQRYQKAGAAPVPRAKDIVLIQPRLRIRGPSTHLKSVTEARKEPSRQKTKQTILKQTRTQSVSLTIKTLLQRQLRASGNAPTELEESQTTAVSDEATVTCTGHGRVNLKDFDIFMYANDIAREVVSGARNLRGNPWIYTPNPFEAFEIIQRQRTGGAVISPADMLSCVLKPTVFIWSPEMLCPAWRLTCPDCMKPTSFSAWAPPRIAHSFDGAYVYMCSIHACNQCSASEASARTSRVRKRFRSDRPDILARAPPATAFHWKFVSAGKTLREASVRDYVRAMATRTSWRGIADGLNEMKHTQWARSVAAPYVGHTKYTWH